MGIIGRLEIFSERDLSAFLTNAHRCLVRTVEELMKKLEQDPSKLDRTSKGFLKVG